MKKFVSFYNWRTVAVFVVICMMFLMVSCEKEPIPPVPPVYVMAVVVLNDATVITKTTATISATVVPNESNTQISFDYKDAGSFETKTLSQTFSGKDSVTVKFDFSDLRVNTEYTFRVKAKSIAGEVISEEKKFTTYSVSDVDGNLYHTVTIGTQTFLKENFRGTHFANGDAIPNVTNPTTWGNLTTGAYCWYNNDPEIGKVYGGLYNWYVGADPRGLIVGWHVPTDEEWAFLSLYLGQYQAAGPKMMEVGSTHWKHTIVSANNSTGFTALPNGLLYPEQITNKFTFQELGETAMFLSSSLFGPGIVVEYIEGKTCFFSNAIDSHKTLGSGLRMLKN